MTFWSQFKRIHENDSLDIEDKFQYLIQATVPGSTARDLVESFPPTSDNYSKAIGSLKSRFGRKDFLIEVYVREFLKMLLSKSTANQYMLKLSCLYDKIETQSRALETLGITTDVCAAMLYPLVESCLAEDLLRVRHRSLKFSISFDATLKDRLNNLIEFLKGEVENKERIKLAMEGFGMCAKDNKGRRFNSVSKEALVPTAASLVNVQSRKCVFVKPVIIKVSFVQELIKCQLMKNRNCCQKKMLVSVVLKLDILAEDVMPS